MAMTAVRNFSIIYQGQEAVVLVIREDSSGIQYLVRAQPDDGGDFGDKIWVHDTHVDRVGICPIDDSDAPSRTDIRV